MGKNIVNDYSDHHCPFCGAGTGDIIRLRAIQLDVQIYPKAQFPVTFRKPGKPDNLGEIKKDNPTSLALCDNNIAWLGLEGLKEEQRKKVRLWCQDL